MRDSLRNPNPTEGMRWRLVRGGALLIAGLLFLDAGCPVAAAPAEVRGTWLTTTGAENHIQSGANTAAVIRDLRNIGLNTAYVETWKNGYTNYPSPVLSSFTGGPDRSTFLGSTRDLVDETVIQVHRQGMAYIGWFEYGLAAQFIGTTTQPSNPLAVKARNNGWLLQDQSGRYGNSSNGFAWMNPLVPEVRQFIVDLAVEFVTRYDVDGIQFDDRLAWPKEFGWDATTAALYLSETGRSLPTSVTNTQFRQWRQSKVTELATQISNAVRAVRPDLLLSVSPSITTFAETEYNANWPDWQNRGLFDEYVPQLYRDNLASFNSILSAQLAPFTSAERDNQLVLGLRVNGTGANTPVSDLQAMIAASRSNATAGHSMFYSEGVRDDYGTQLASFYDVASNGQAPNPHFGDQRRPPAVVGVQSGGEWNFEVTSPDRYRVVGRINSTLWRELGTVTLATGTHQLSIPGALQAELLVDRRPLGIADFDGSGTVEPADYSLWRDSLGMVVYQGAWTDIDRSGTVDQADYLRWLADFGRVGRAAVASGGGSVPEPYSLLTLAVMLALTGRLRNRVRGSESWASTHSSKCW